MRAFAARVASWCVFFGVAGGAASSAAAPPSFAILIHGDPHSSASATNAFDPGDWTKLESLVRWATAKMPNHKLTLMLGWDYYAYALKSQSRKKFLRDLAKNKGYELAVHNHTCSHGMWSGFHSAETESSYETICNGKDGYAYNGTIEDMMYAIDKFQDYLDQYGITIETIAQGMDDYDEETPAVFSYRTGVDHAVTATGGSYRVTCTSTNRLTDPDLSIPGAGNLRQLAVGDFEPSGQSHDEIQAVLNNASVGIYGFTFHVKEWDANLGSAGEENSMDYIKAAFGLVSSAKTARAAIDDEIAASGLYDPDGALVNGTACP